MKKFIKVRDVPNNVNTQGEWRNIVCELRSDGKSYQAIKEYQNISSEVYQSMEGLGIRVDNTVYAQEQGEFREVTWQADKLPV